MRERYIEKKKDQRFGPLSSILQQISKNTRPLIILNSTYSSDTNLPLRGKHYYARILSKEG